MTEAPPRQVVLVGAPGSGKSSVGRRLAERWGVGFVDVDDEIAAAAGTPISAIFADHGEAHFRALEVRHTLASLERPGVISLGGGAVTSPAITEALAGREVVWLGVSAATAAGRVGLNVSRPLLLGNVRGRLVKLLAERTPLYAAVATRRIDTDDLSADEVVERIVDAGRA